MELFTLKFVISDGPLIGILMFIIKHMGIMYKGTNCGIINNVNPIFHHYDKTKENGLYSRNKRKVGSG